MWACGRRWRWPVLLALLAPLLLLLLNVRLHHLLPPQPPQPPHSQDTRPHPQYLALLSQLKDNFVSSQQHNISHIWAAARKWPQGKYIFSVEKPIGNVLEALRSAKILHADNSRKGTQLKLLLTLEGDQKVFFKPQWYSRDFVVRGSVYSGKDRHNAEVVAFYLSAILDIKWAPISAIRRVNIKTEIWDKATPELKETMIRSDNGTMCLYGKCFYCKRNETVCGNKQDELEGAIILLINHRFNKYRSPWQRTYDVRKQADWENNPDYCTKVKKVLTPVRVLDLIDGAIFDFLLQNGDRHHYETLMDRVVLLDNGKGLGNPHKDFNDILAPLYQCCVLRHTTWKRLKLLSGGYLSETLSALLSQEPGGPIMTDLHLQAMDRRLHTIYSVVEKCLEQYGKSIFKEK